MTNSDRYPLRRLIFDDLLNHNKLALLLFCLVIGSAVATIWITHQTRLLTIEQDKLADQNQHLESQYIHLQLEEHSLSTKKKVEKKAGDLQLHPINKEQEVILLH